MNVPSACHNAGENDDKGEKMKRPIGLIHTHHTSHAACEKESIKKAPIVPVDFKHCAIVGETGCGKTSSAILPNIDYRISQGHGILVYDYKGNMHAVVKALAKRHGRLDDVVMIGQPWGKKINLISSMSIKDVDSLVSIMIGMKPEDAFWINSARTLILPAIELFRKVEKVKRDLSEIDFTVETEVSTGNRGEKEEIVVRYDLNPSFRSVLEAYRSIFSIKAFASHYETIRKRLERWIAANEQILKENVYLSINLIDLVDLLKKLEKSHNQYKNMPLDRHNTYTTIHMTVTAALENLSTEEYLNTEEVDVADLLNHGKIVVIDTREIKNDLLAYFTQSVFENLRLRFGNASHAPVSIFIDEAQKVLNKYLEIPVDTMREARVEVFMAFQNAALIRQQIGEDGYEALHTNLTKKIVYKNDVPFGEVETENLNAFEYRTNMDGDRFETVFETRYMEISKLEIFEAELEFQQNVGAFGKYRLQEAPSEDCILIYQPSLYQRGILELALENGQHPYSRFIEEKKLAQLEERLCDFQINMLIDQ